MKGRWLLQPGYLLHQQPYRDSGRILEVFTREQGRFTLFARGVRRAGSPYLPVLQPFQRLLLSYTAREEAGQFVGAELAAEPAALPAARLLSGFYLNELVIKLLARHDAHPEVFELYEATLAGLRAAADEALVLRLFEKRLLELLGYGPSLDREIEGGTQVVAGAAYRYRPGHGVVRVDGVAEGGLIFSGSSLLALAAERLDDAAGRADARRLLRAALDHCLEGRTLRSREVAAAVRERRVPRH